MTKLLQQCFLFFIVVVIPGINLGNSQVSVNKIIGPTLVNDNVFTKFGLNRSIRFQDIEQKLNSDVNQGP